MSLVQIIAALILVVHFTAYLFFSVDTLEQVKHLLWILLGAIVFLHENLLGNLLEDEDEGNSD